MSAISVIIPVINETDSLKKTIETIIRLSDRQIKEYLLVIHPKKTEPESLAVCRSFQGRLGDRLKILTQNLPGLGGAMRDALQMAQGSHAILMFSDGESDPELVPKLIEEAKTDPDAIINVSRWLPGGRFEGYPLWKYVLNYLYQVTYSALYGTTMKDLTFGYRLVPVRLMNQILWQETLATFYLESLFKPLRMGARIHEVPGIWRARAQGRSQKKLTEYLRYYWIPFKFRLYPPAA